MQKIIKEFQLNYVSDCLNQFCTKDTLLFDIECTGLSPRTAQVYLIGCAFRCEKTITIVQFLMDDLSEEESLLVAFDEFLKKYNNLMGFNSTRFDQPFLEERYKKYNLPHSLKTKNHTDLYLTSTKLKCLIDLPNYKQKSIEQFLGLYRKDEYDGGQLIPVYKDYAINKNEEALKLVLLHNYEDVKGMITAIDFLAYLPLLKSNIILDDYVCESDDSFVRVTARLPFRVPNNINKKREYGLIIISNNSISLILDIHRLSLNTYLKDFKNYVYHTEENIIIPKVLATTIDKALIRPATREDCHASLDGCFVRIPEHIEVSSDVRIFKESFKSKDFYIQSSDMNEDIAKQLIRYIIKH